MNLAVAQFAVVDGRNDFFGEGQRYIDADQFVGSRVSDFHVKIAGGGGGHGQSRNQQNGRG